jgi:hypothetical protein
LACCHRRRLERGRDDGRDTVVALFDEAEEGIGLLRLHNEIVDPVNGRAGCASLRGADGVRPSLPLQSSRQCARYWKLECAPGEPELHTTSDEPRVSSLIVGASYIPTQELYAARRARACALAGLISLGTDGSVLMSVEGAGATGHTRHSALAKGYRPAARSHTSLTRTDLPKGLSVNN